MPRVHTQKARKDYPAEGIKRGDAYYSWEFRTGGVHRSKTRPRPSQLTQGKLSGAYAAREALEDTIADPKSTPEEIAQACRDAASEVESVREEYEESLGNMPDSLQQSSTGEEIQTKIDALEEYSQALEEAANEIDALDAADYRDEEDDKDRDINEYGDLSAAGQAAMREAAVEAAEGPSLEV